MKDWSQYKPEVFEYNGKWIRNWFSNFVTSPIEVEGYMWPSVENFYQSRKTTDIKERAKFLYCTPSEAKREGRKVTMRPDWEKVKYEMMKQGLWAKFSSGKWREKLLATGDEMIIEWNNWRDDIWGVPINTNKGQNLLGQALMEIRNELKQ